ncbi:BREX-1 system adenine-specific DNA-methyltransferase PglX [Enterococcus faecalis]|uniref:BREX-1 system adenine-specific DNA-methyltransferase PglX n=1 Tax=Enterococcus faecalis TaxID=1351 RepID=UPI0019ED3031|nr:BREX-1 system adenine-specific DNA-methyltransferase PglX [Enterococcus faecalis]EGO5147184.1 BREX-1 system adenine-specific DNA-methyltransferase PglX [Enterococcus faecalis]EHA3055222.1 BREX-1 system adenine-specific DNA-methyltransferase PglX [Enterococcus faecalis]EJM6076472.1 BREX-1 system adenine-specific DNA-methyltransferase PglX [Enterococcus faecalis]EJZ8440944.1 BREX-1 system adenine-specific DNA-methyltransferase PglX [Enterococcus faecalis]MCD4890261.1 BREX-1 system adenine-spe
MDKKAIKKFAMESRVKLREGVINKLTKLGITESNIEPVTELGNDTITISSSKQRYTGKDVINRTKLVEALKAREKQLDLGEKKSKAIAFDNLVEEVAYTWFNRLIAIRFMEVNNYLPERQRILSSESGIREPDIITNLLSSNLYAEMDPATKSRVVDLMSDNSAAAVDELYQLVFIKQCNSLNQLLPDLFEKIDDYTELLFTISYIDENGVIASLLSIPEDDFDVSKEGQVEIIGWMYQYYNTEPKAEAMKAQKKRKSRADEIPALTQLFTPDWIVRYMVENSLGRYYIDQKLAMPTETRTEKEIADEFGWKYYLPTAEQPENVQLQIQDERKDKNVIALQEIKLLDNAMGSGHVLVYAFDVFMQLYVAEGFRERDAAESILINNLFGLEIDKRSYQLAYFAIMMKGREYSRRILTKNVKLHLHQFIDSDDIPNEYFERLEEISSLPSDEFIEKSNLLKLVLDMFLHATELGSVLNIQNISQSEIDELRQLTGAFEDFSNMDILYQLPEAHEKVNHILNIVEVLSFRYTAVVTNPPYLNKMSSILSKYVKDNYPEVKTDLFSVFIKMNSQMLTDGGYAGFMTPFVWMFIKSYEELRDFLIANKNISSLVQMEYSAFEEATVPVCCFTIKNAKSEPIGNYFKLSDFRGGMNVQKEKVLEGIRNPDVNYLFQTNQNNFTKIPGSPISFWVSENLVNFYTNTPPIKNFAFAKAGIVTGIDAEFVRFWHEINQKNISFSENNNDNYDTFSYYPFAKGGSFRRWYGNKEYVINLNKLWNDPNINKSVRRGDQSAYFKKSISWSYVTSGKSSFRQYEDVAFATAAPELIVKNKNQYDSLLAFLNTKIADYIFDMINPTLNLPSSYVTSTPFIIAQIQVNEYVNRLSEKNVILSKRDWDSFEESWEYVKHPLI